MIGTLLVGVVAGLIGIGIGASDDSSSSKADANDSIKEIVEWIRANEQKKKKFWHIATKIVLGGSGICSMVLLAVSKCFGFSDLEQLISIILMIVVLFLVAIVIYKCKNKA